METYKRYCNSHLPLPPHSSAMKRTFPLYQSSQFCMDYQISWNQMKTLIIYIFKASVENYPVSSGLAMRDYQININNSNQQGMLTMISASRGLVQRDGIMGLAKGEYLVNFGFASAFRNAITLQILWYNSQGIASIRTSSQLQCFLHAYNEVIFQSDCILCLM